MAPDDPKDPGKKKLKVIDWHFSDTVASEVEAGGSDEDKPNWILRSVVLLLVGFLAFVGVRGWQVYQEIQQEVAQAKQSLPEFQNPELSSPGAIPDEFVSRPRAQLARDEAHGRILDARRSIDGNPVIMQRLLAVEKTFQEGERLLQGRNYGEAFNRFQDTERSLDSFNQQISDKNEALAARDDFLLMKDRLDPHRNIAREAYESAFVLFSEGIYFLDNGSFSEARSRFEDALEDMGAVQERLDDYMDRQIQDGQRAIAMGDAAVAQEVFNTVLEINDDSEVAQLGLKRAEVLNQVYPMLEQAKDFEQSGQLVKANDLYVSSLELDPKSARAQAGAARTEKEVKELAFNQALYEALEAAEEENWFAAIEATEKALEVYPENEEVREQLKEFEKLEYETNIRRGLAKARDFEKAREFTLAQDAFEEVLDLDPENEKAIEGIRRTGDTIRAMIRYEKLIELAQSEAVENLDFQSSITYFNEAMGIKPDFLPLKPDAVKLKSFLEKQSKPVGLSLNSDNRTWVSISGYDHLGKFNKKSIKILPGKYRIVGRRKGFEDAIRSITIIAGEGIWVDNQKANNWEIEVVPRQRAR